MGGIFLPRMTRIGADGDLEGMDEDGGFFVSIVVPIVVSIVVGIEGDF